MGLPPLLMILRRPDPAGVPIVDTIKGAGGKPTFPTCYSAEVRQLRFALALHASCKHLERASRLTIAHPQIRFTPTMKAFVCACILVVLCITTSAQSGQSPLAPPKVPAPSASGTSLKLGVKAPDFALPNGDGKLVVLSEYTQRSPVVLVFYRGFW